jgi:lysophospholipase L1-like esterase
MSLLLNPAAPVIAARGYRLAIIGESLAEHHHTANSSLKLSSWSRGFINWSQVLNPGLFTFDVWYDATVRPGWEPTGAGSTVSFRGANAGVGGQTSSQIVARHRYLIDNTDYDIIVISAGTNDMASVAADTIAANRQALVDAFIAAGKLVILLPVLMRDDVSWTTASGYRKKCHYVNQKARELVASRRNCFMFDWNEYWIDFNSANGNPKAGYSPDGIHTTTLAGYAIGKMFGQFMARILPLGSRRVVAPDDLFDAALNPLGNKAANPMLTGAGGTVSAPVTGTCADSYRILRNTSIGCACAASKEARADGRGNYQVLTFTPNQVAGTELFYWQTATTDIAHNLPVGTWVRASMEVDVSAWAGWQGITMHLRDNAVGGILAYGMEDYSADQWPTETWSGVIFTPPFQIINASSTLRFQPRIKIDNSKTGSGVLKIGAPELRPCADPRTLVNYRESA